MSESTSLCRDDVTPPRRSPIAMDVSAFRAVGHQLVDQLAGLLDAVA